jgi:hypothetical protein
VRSLVGRKSKLTTSNCIEIWFVGWLVGLSTQMFLGAFEVGRALVDLLVFLLPDGDRARGELQIARSLATAAGSQTFNVPPERGA